MPQPSSLPRPDIHLEPFVNVLVSVSTPPLLMGLLAQRQCGQLIQDLGQLSESLFQGQRLPVLIVPEAEASEEGKTP